METGEHDYDPNEPVYLLSLDGGGVRGISEAVILHEIMTRIQQVRGLETLPRPCDYFHLIGGTSTGGLIALMLGRLRMTTQEVLDEYESISESIFSSTNRRIDRTYKEAQLEKAVRAVSEPRIGKEPMGQPNVGIEKGQSFVVSLRKGGDENTPTMFRSYPLQRQTTDCQIWEAARATTAAPGFFAPAKVKIKGKWEWFIDGAVKWNNPTPHVLSEAEALYGHHRKLGCLLSLGTGIQPPSLNQKQKERQWIKYNIFELKRMALGYLTDPEPAHREIEARLQKQPDSYFRFSVPYSPGEDRIRITEYQKMQDLRRSTEKYLMEEDVSNRLDEFVEILCRKKASDLTLYAACYASSQETALADMHHMLDKQKVTSPAFTGREDILNALDHAFSPREAASYPRRDYWLWGVAGVGKTQIALRFIDCFRTRFDRVLWIDATNSAMIHYSFQTIASEVLPHAGEGSQILSVLNWLNTTKEEWLIVVDNYDDGDITRYLPGRSRGNILFTSRRNNLEPRPPRASMFNVSEMSLSDSARLLLCACRMDEDDEYLQAQTYPLVKELGSLPLALDSMGAYIHMQGWTFERCLEYLREEKSKLLSEAPQGSDASKNPSVYATFELSLKSIKSYSRGCSNNALYSQSALQILNNFCFYHSEGISMELILRAGIGIMITRRWHDIGLAPPSGEKTTKKVLGISAGDKTVDIDYITGGVMVLLRFSLLKQPGRTDSYSIHPLVHSWLRDRMHSGSYDKSLRMARTILYQSFHRSIRDTDAERFYPSLLPHMKAIQSHQFKGKDVTSLGDEMDMRWKYLQILNRSRLWDEAVVVLEQDVEAFILDEDRDHWQTLNAMVELGKAYMATGKIIDAEDVLLQVLDRTRSCSSQKWARICYVRACSELSMVYLVQGSFGIAQLMAEVALKAGNATKVGTLDAKARLSLVYQYAERWEDAKVLAQEILDIRLGLKQQGVEHPKTLKARAELACIWARLGDTSGAERVLSEVAERFGRDLGPNHYDTLVARTNLAWVYFRQGRLDEAEAVQREVLATGRSVLGPDHLYTLYMMIRLGITVGESGQHDEAITLLRECVERRKAALWIVHPAVAGADMWKSVFEARMDGYDLTVELSPAELETVETGKRLGEYSYAPVQI